MAEPETRRPLSVVLLAVLAAVAGGYAAVGRQPTPDTTKAAAPQKKDGPEGKGLPTPGPLSPLRDFFQTGESVPKLFGEDSDDLRKHYVIDSLIVTVPDPVGSRFGFVFDELVAVIQRALEGCDYVFDRSWLPWEHDRKALTEKSPATKVRVDLFGLPLRAGAVGASEESSYRERYPGVMLFRGGQSEAAKGGPHFRKLLVVFLVGENPTSGIAKRAFTTSLELAQQCSENSATKFRIVGPYFTGSQSSLKNVLDAWLADGKHKKSSFDVISGAATAVSQDKIIPAAKRTTFRATVIPSKLLLEATLHYLETRNTSTSEDQPFSDGLDRVAYLVEANTGFGQSVIRTNERDVLILPFPMHISGVAASYEKARLQQEEQLGLPRMESLIPRLGIFPGTNDDLIPAQDPATTASVSGKVLTELLRVITRRHIRYVGIVASDPRDTVFLASCLREHCPDVQIFVIGSDLLYCLPDFSYYLRGTIVASTYPLVPVNQRWTDPERRSRQVFPGDGAQGYFNAVLAQLGQVKKMIEYRAPRFNDSNGDESKADRPPIWITMIGQDGGPVPLQFFRNYEDQGYLWLPAKAQRPDEVKKMDLGLRGTAVVSLLAVCFLTALVLVYAFRRRSAQPFWPEPADAPNGWGNAYRFVCLASFAVLLLPVAHLCAIYEMNAEPPGGREWWETVLLFPPFFLLALMGPALVFPLLPPGKCFLRKNRFWGELAVGAACAAVAGLPILSPALWSWICGNSRTPVGLWTALLAYPVGFALLGLLLEAAWERARPGWPGDRGRGLICSALVGLAALACALGIFRTYGAQELNSWEALFFFRSLDFPSGVSLLLPLFFLCAAYFFWAFFRMKGRWDFFHFRVPSPFPGPDRPALFTFVRQGEERLAGELCSETGARTWFGRRHRLELILLLFVPITGACLLWQRFLPTAEGPLTSAVFFWGLTLGSLLVAANLLRFLTLWSLLRGLLHEIALLPMTGQFGRLPAKVRSVFGGYLFPPRPRASHARVAAQQLGLLRRETERLLGEPAGKDEFGVTRKELKEVADRITAYEDKMNGRLEKLAAKGAKGSAPGLDDRDEADAQDLREDVSGIARELLKILPTFWPRRTVEAAFGIPEPVAPAGKENSLDAAESGGRKGDGQPRPATPAGLFARWVELAEGAVAMQVVSYLGQFFVQLRTLAWAMIICSVLLLLSATSYPFQPGRLILYTMLALLGAVIVSILYVLVQVNRDELVSRISGTTPNRFTLDTGFLHSVFTYIVPAVGVVALQLSGTFRFLLEPVVRVLK